MNITRKDAIKRLNFVGFYKIYKPSNLRVFCFIKPKGIKKRPSKEDLICSEIEN